MSDSLEKLRATLADLHDELESVELLDEQTSGLLKGAVDDINASLEQQDAAALRDESLGTRLSEAARGFEESHPALAHLVGNILDALAGIGI
ncbi:MAG: DUF4404 family protein [Planctomycetes bacterium]|nr:DUF4404 family protein [Planctomycetota bacterium]